MNKPPFASYAALEAYLETRGFFRMEPGLERMEQLLQKLHLQRPPFFCAQVLGTNGKGSTSTFLAALAGEHGLATGLYTSPHFVSIRERVRINGRMLGEEAWLDYGNKALTLCPELTYFEFTTAIAMIAFAAAKVDLAILEAGLGGSFDATTAVSADLTLFAPIDLDHAAVLGPTIAHIAGDKAGAIREKTPVFSAPQTLEARLELQKAAQNMHAPLTFCRALSSAYALGLPGAHQHVNAGLALEAFGYVAARLGLRPGEDKIRQALKSAFIPGRLQKIPANPAPGKANGLPDLILDGAHNPHGLAALGQALAEEGIAPCAVVFSCLGDKDVRNIAAQLRILATGPIFIPPIEDNPRALAPAELTEKLGLAATSCASLREALDAAFEVARERGNAKNPVLVCGSLYMLGQFFSLYPEYLETPA